MAVRPDGVSKSFKSGAKVCYRFISKQSKEAQILREAALKRREEFIAFYRAGRVVDECIFSDGLLTDAVFGSIKRVENPASGQRYILGRLQMPQEDIYTGVSVQKNSKGANLVVDKARAFISRVFPDGTKDIKSVVADFLSGEGVIKHSKLLNGELKSVEARCPSETMWELDDLRETLDFEKTGFYMEFAIRDGFAPLDLMSRFWGR